MELSRIKLRMVNKPEVSEKVTEGLRDQIAKLDHRKVRSSEKCLVLLH